MPIDATSAVLRVTRVIGKPQAHVHEPAVQIARLPRITAAFQLNAAAVAASCTSADRDKRLFAVFSEA